MLFIHLTTRLAPPVQYLPFYFTQTTIERKVLCVKERVVAIYVLLREYLSVE